MARVVSVNISEEKGTPKHPVESVTLKLRHGIVGDAHAGDWHRQVSLLAEESIDTLRAALPDLCLGETEVEVTQIGKECHGECAIRKAAGTCVMPTEGIFAVVRREGVVHPGDTVEIIKEVTP